MKAAQIKEFGGAGIVHIAEIPAPEPTGDQVQVEVHAASINPFDTAMREGRVKFPLPATLGGDIAGIITKVGEGVAHVKPGDRVYGSANAIAGNSGAFAETAVTKSTEVAPMPAGVSFEQAAALVLTGLSALQVLEDHMKLQSGQKLLVHGAAGGIGTAAVQLGKHLGAYVAATATGDGLEHVRALGADEVIDYKTTRFEDVIHDFDAVLDTVAGETYERSFAVLRRGGIIVSMLAQPDTELMQKYGVRAESQQSRTTVESLNRLTELVEAGAIKAYIDRTFPLEQVQEAFEARESGKIRGKVVLEIR
jgi:alcohol dehydrogenase